METEVSYVDAQIVSILTDRAVVVVVVVMDDNFLRVAGEDANIESDGLEFFNEYFKGFRDGGFRVKI